MVTHISEQSVSWQRPGRHYYYILVLVVLVTTSTTVVAGAGVRVLKENEQRPVTKRVQCLISTTLAWVQVIRKCNTMIKKWWQPGIYVAWSALIHWPRTVDNNLCMRRRHGCVIKDTAEVLGSNPGSDSNYLHTVFSQSGGLCVC